MASIANSLLLPLSAALHLNVTFWILVVTNFLLMHAIWISQVVRVRRWDRADFGPVFIWSLAAFAVLGNLSLAIWESQLTAIFPNKRSAFSSVATLADAASFPVWEMKAFGGWRQGVHAPDIYGCRRSG